MACGLWCMDVKLGPHMEASMGPSSPADTRGPPSLGKQQDCQHGSDCPSVPKTQSPRSMRAHAVLSGITDEYPQARQSSFSARAAVVQVHNLPCMRVPWPNLGTTGLFFHVSACLVFWTEDRFTFLHSRRPVMESLASRAPAMRA